MRHFLVSIGLSVIIAAGALALTGEPTYALIAGGSFAFIAGVLHRG